MWRSTFSLGMRKLARVGTARLSSSPPKVFGSLFARFATLKSGGIARRPPKLRVFVFITAAVMGLLIWVGWRIALVTGTSRNVTGTNSVDLARDIPLHVEPLISPILSKDSPEAVWLTRMLQEPPPGPLNVSY